MEYDTVTSLSNLLLFCTAVRLLTVTPLTPDAFLMAAVIATVKDGLDAWAKVTPENV